MPKNDRKRLQVIKDYLTYVPVIHTPAFPPMPRLYMELLENKAKVKPELRNKEYDPKERSPSQLSPPIIIQPPQQPKIIEKYSQESPKPIGIKSALTSQDRSTSKRTLKIIDTENDNLDEGFPRRSDILDKEYTESRIPQTFRETRDKKSDNHEDRKTENKKSDDDYDDRKSEEQDDKYKREDYSNNKHKDEEIDELEKILKGEPDKPKKTFQEPVRKEIPIQTSNIPPSLSDIASGKPIVDDKGIRNTEHVTKEEQDEYSKKADLLFKFKILKRNYKEAVIPDYTEFTDYKTIQREYDGLIRQLSLDATVENYRKYLIIAFYGLEMLLLNILKFKEISGFTQQQLLGMNQYERILYQIGEKQWLLNKKPWPPELVLFGTVLLNGAIFVGGKMLMKSTGANIMEMLNSSTPNVPPATKVKMKGPDINLDDLTGKKNS